MVGIDLRGKLMSNVALKQNYSTDSISHGNESSFNSILDKKQVKHTEKEYTRDNSYDKDEKYENEDIKPKDTYENKIEDTRNDDEYESNILHKDDLKEKDSHIKSKEVSEIDSNLNIEEIGKNKLDDKETAELEEEILTKLSEMLGIGKQELTEWLSQQGYDVNDLLDFNMFIEVMRQIYLELKNEDLLLVDNGISNINEVYDGIKKLENEFMGKEILDSNINNDISEIINQLQKMNTQGNRSETTNQSINMGINVQNTDSTRYSLNQNNTDNLKQINIISGQVSDSSSMGIETVMPINQFRTSNKVNLWSNEVLNTTKSNIMTKNLEVDIIKQIDFKQIGVSKEIHMKLTPQELGEMSIRLVEENSNIVAQISVDNEKTKEILSSQLEVLKASLEESGINIKDVTVDIKQNSHQSQMQKEKQKSSKRIEELISRHMGENGSGDEIIEEIKISEVDYTA